MWKSINYFNSLIDTMPVEIAGRVQVLDNGDLLIAAVKPNDAGKYTCIRANEAGSVNGSAYLSVLGKIYFINIRIKKIFYIYIYIYFLEKLLYRYIYILNIIFLLV